MAPSNQEVDELRRRFGANVPIINRIPSAEEVVERESWLERIAGTVGLEKWMWKSRRGLLIAIIVVPPGISGLIDFWSPPIRAGIEYARPYIGVIENTAIALGQRMVVFLPERGPERLDPIYPHAILAPAVGQMITVAAGITNIDVRVYRLAYPRYDPLDGLGPSRFGGRWNSPGPRLLYTSDSILTAIEELRPHLPLNSLKNFVLHEIRVSALAEILPRDRSKILIDDSYEASRQVGDDWIRRGQSDVLVAPSSVDPFGHTVVINLAHAERMDIKLARSTPISL